MSKDTVSIYPEPITIASAVTVNESNIQAEKTKLLTVSPQVAPCNDCNDDKIYGLTLKVFYIISIVTSIIIFSFAQPKYEFSSNGTKEISKFFLPHVQKCCREVRDFGEQPNDYGLCPLIEKERNDHRFLDEYSVKFVGDEGIFDAFLDRPGIIFYTSVLVISCILIWFQLLQYYAKHVVIATEILKLVSILFCAVYLVVEVPGTRTSTFNALVFIGVGAYCIYVYVNFDYILKAAELITHSTIIVGNNGRMTYKLLGLKVMYILQTVLLLITICFSYEIVEVKPLSGSCYFVSPAYMKYMNTFQIFVWIWTVWTLDMIRLMIVATITGSNYFHGTNSSAEQSFSEAYSRAFGQSFGTLSFAGLVTSFLDALRKRNKRCFMWIGPQAAILIVIEAILFLFGTCFLHLVFVLTKFSVVIHAFTGKSLIDSGKHCYQIMNRRFIGGFVTEISSHSVLWTTAIIFSIITSTISWGWIDVAFDCTSFKDQTYVLIFIILGLFFTHPVLGVLLVIVINMTYEKLETYSFEKGEATYQHVWVPPLAAAFVGFVTKLIFTFVGGIILDAVDTSLVCFAIDEDNGVKDRMNGSFAIIVKDMDEYIKAEPVVHYDVEAKEVQYDNISIRKETDNRES